MSGDGDVYPVLVLAEGGGRSGGGANVPNPIPLPLPWVGMSNLSWSLPQSPISIPQKSTWDKRLGYSPHSTLPHLCSPPLPQRPGTSELLPLPLWTDKQSENITFPRTSFAGGYDMSVYTEFKDLVNNFNTSCVADRDYSRQTSVHQDRKPEGCSCSCQENANSENRDHKENSFGIETGKSFFCICIFL